MEQAADQIVSVTAAQLAQTTFVSHVGDLDDLSGARERRRVFSAHGVTYTLRSQANMRL